MRAARRLTFGPVLAASLACLLLAHGPGNNMRMAALASGLEVLATEPAPLSVRITSPHGRLPSTGPIRIVARVRAPEGAAITNVSFYLDDVLLGEDREGPAYAVEWMDDNPFLPHDIRVEATDSAGRRARDLLKLEPLEITDDAQITRVLLEVSAFDAEGRSLAGLRPADFTVFEDEAPQTVEMLDTQEVPTTFLLLVDHSQSMAVRIDFVQRAARRLISYLRPRDQVIVVPFARGAGSVTGPTTDHDTIIEAIGAIASGGGTAIYDAVRDAAARLANVEGRRAIVLLTDGYDEHSTSSMTEAIEAVARVHATLYTVGIGGVAGISIAGQDALKRLARASSGQAYFPFRDEELPFVHERIAGDVQHRYLLSYMPTNERRDGGWRAVRLQVSRPDVRVSTTPGYFAPPPPPIRPSIEFTVRDTAREYTDLGAEDFTVLEDGVPQQIQRFGEAVTPLSIVVALDASGSMRTSADAVKRAARGFIESLRPQDKLSVELFSEKTRFACDLSTRREVSLDAVDRYTPQGGTALYDAVGEALDRLKGVQGRGIVVLLTDGRDENNAGDGPGSVRTEAMLQEALRNSSVTIYTIGLGSKVDRALLERLATDTGGEAYFPDEGVQLADDYQRILDSLRRRYVLSYTSTNGARNGAWRAVDVRARQPRVLVMSAGGYFAPER